jgi:formylglycine-generating enzyme required for sulfatase activity
MLWLILLAAVGSSQSAACVTHVVQLENLPEGARRLELILVEPGRFVMGCERTERGLVSREWWPHEVTISRPFYLGRYEITHGQWKAVMGKLPAACAEGDDDLPITHVTWNECQRFVAILAAKARFAVRLPTEAEWEYACRAGSRTRFWFGDALECSDVREYCPHLDRYLWWGGNNGKHGYPTGPKRVGLKAPNLWGFHDMHGNVWEFCSDWWQKGEPRAPQTDPRGPSMGTHKVMRGGAWESHALHLRSADRSLNLPDDIENGRLIGLRLAADVPGDR